MQTTVTVLAVLVVALAAILLGFSLGDESRLRADNTAVSADPQPMSDESAGQTGSADAAASSATKSASADMASVSGGSTSVEEISSTDTASSESDSLNRSSAGTAGISSQGSDSSSTVPASNGHIVCIDAGHQDHGMSDTEPNAPGSSTMKAKLTSGTEGNYSGVPEYEVNLEVSLRLRDELERRGYTVVMTRTTNDVEISNVERAQIANEAGADIFIRIHCNSSSDSSVHGALAYVPSDGNAYLGSGVIEDSQRLGSILLEQQIAVTGQESRGLLYGDDMTGINWAQMPVTIIEMGFMSNRDEDLFLTSEEGQNLIMIGLANGVDKYFEGAA